jgi:hypothetical protein
VTFTGNSVAETSGVAQSSGKGRVGLIASAIVGMAMFGLAVSIDFPRVSYGFQSDGATYYSLAYSIAEDGDFAYEKKDLVRVWREFPTGPEGIFLKRGKRLGIERSPSFPYFSVQKRDDERTDRLYYGKSYIYPLVAAPFVRLFGTNGFLVLHALLMMLNFAAAYTFLAARSSPAAALPYALAFLFASAVPVYIVWLTPDFFNLSVVLYGLFLWSYKLVAPQPAAAASRWERFLFSPRSDLAAAALLGVATFSKPTNILVVAPVLILAAWQRRWRDAIAAGAVFAVVVGGLVAGNAAITGELNFQGGDRRTFYGRSEFPFQNQEATFETRGMGRATDRVPTDVLFTRDALLSVFPNNLVYFALGRYSGLVPYFFPGVVSAVLFITARRSRAKWQWLVAGTLAVSSLGLLVYMPFTYSGGGGPVGNRYFMGLYPLFLFLTPPLASAGSALVAAGIGFLFTAQLVLNPFYTSFHPAEHPKSGAFRLLPVELSLLNDLPISVNPTRVRQSLGGDPPVRAYFLDDNAFDRERDSFWVRGGARADVILRAAAPEAVPLRLAKVQFKVTTGDVKNRVTVRTSAGRSTVEMGPWETRFVTLEAGRGLPYRPTVQPTNYLYLVSIETERGFVPHFTMGSSDARFLGTMIGITPVYEK